MEPNPSRNYASDADLQQMLDLLMESRALTDDWRYLHVGDLLFWFFMLLIHLEPYRHIRLWHAGEKLVGYAMLGEDPSFDVQVHPQYAWHGIEEQALDWAETFLAELRQSDPERWGGQLVSSARQDDPQRMAFLERHGFRPGGEFSEVNMLYSLDAPIPAPVVASGCQVRAMQQDELNNRAGAQRVVWLPWSVGQVSDADYAKLMQLPGYDPELDIVSVAPDGVIAAYVNGWNDPLNKIGDFGPVGTRPAYRRQGLAKAALLECLRRMQAQGMQRVSVSTNNLPAQRLYEAVGFRVVNEYIEYVKPNPQKEQDG
jgi:mycothiol synthase